MHLADLFCNPINPSFLFFSENVPSLVYYSHLPIIFISLVLGLVVYANGRKNLPNQILFSMLIPFVFWVFLDSVFWASNRADVIMFVWTLQILLEPLVYIGALYLVYVLITKRDAPFVYKLGASLLYLPLAIITPTALSLSAFDITSCLAVETNFSYYSYVIEILYAVWIIGFSIYAFRSTKDEQQRKHIKYLTFGVIAFLLSFSTGNIVSSFSDDWNYAQVGLFMVPVFIGFISYSIVQFKTFNMKVVGSNVFVLALWATVASLLFVNDLNIIRILLLVTLVFMIILGVFLMKGVKKEVKLREDLQLANTRLVDLDKQKSEFVSFATHQLKSPLAAMKGYASLILDGDYGEINADVRESVSRIFESSKTLAHVVEDYLNISRIELGSMKYYFADLDAKKIVGDVVAEMEPNIKKAGIEVTFTAPDDAYMISADPDKIKQVYSNLIDNSVKYTPKGKIEVSLKKIKNKVLFTVADTGIGMKPDTIETLFAKFTRAYNANMTNIHGTGLGLYIARQIAEAHHGKVWAESDGEGKGSRFFVELEAKK
jgi:signal transduction histidine kinase